MPVNDRGSIAKVLLFPSECADTEKFRNCRYSVLSIPSYTQGEQKQLERGGIAPQAIATMVPHLTIGENGLKPNEVWLLDSIL